MAVLATLALGLVHGAALAAWEAAWQIGDTWTYQVESLEFPGPYTRLPFRGHYTLTLTVIGGATAEPWGGVPVWVWTLQIEHDKYGFPTIAKETLHVVEGIDVARWPLPTLFLWFDVTYRPEEGAARVGIRWDGTGPAVWERRIPEESAGVPVGERVYRVVIEPVGTDTVEVAGSLVEASQFHYRAETRIELVGARPRLRVHSGTAWGSSAVRNWIRVEGREEEDGRVVREYRLDLVSFSPGADEGVGPSRP